MRKEVILTTLALRAGYGGKPVLQGLEIEVREGEIVAVIGRNGVGKSTLMESLIGEAFPILAERWSQRAGTMSGGQQQQLAIGRVLIADPNLILLDEPSEGIQPNIVQDIARNMVELNRTTGVTIILVEQNLDMIRAMALRCYVMDKGRIDRKST